MAKEIGRLHSFGVGNETVAGTPAAIDYWLPLEEGNLKPVVEKVNDESGIGIIDELSDAHIARIKSEFSAKGILRSKSAGLLLLGAFGASAAPTTLETGVYSHEFTRLNSNSHPTFTIIHDNATSEEQVAYAMVDSLKIACEVGSQAKFDLSMVGKMMTTTTGTTPAFPAGDEPFLVTNMAVKFATNLAGLGAAAVIPVQNLNIEIAKNLTQIFSSSSVAGTEALDFASQHNQQFGITGDLELVYNADTYKTLYTANTKQAISIKITGKTLVGATKYNSIEFIFAAVSLEDWDRKITNNEIVNETIGFSALYSIADTKTASVTLVNTVSTQYSA